MCLTRLVSIKPCCLSLYDKIVKRGRKESADNLLLFVNARAIGNLD